VVVVEAQQRREQTRLLNFHHRLRVPKPQRLLKVSSDLLL